MNKKLEATKFAFVGSSSVGKTTLLETYKKRYSGNPNVVFVEEAARIFFTAHPQISVLERFQVAAQSQVQNLALKQEQVAHESGAGLIICDRSVLDAVAYVRSTGDIKGAERLLKKVSGWINSYTSLFLLDPADVPFENDDVRQEDQNTRQKFHDAFIELFESEGIRHEILSGTIAQRIEIVDQVVAQSGAL